MRDVAAEVGISLASLHNFLHGAEPRPANRKKLTEWYVRTMPQRGEVLSPEMAGAFLALMLDGIAAEKRDAAERAVREVLRKVYRDAGAEPPGWLSAPG